VGIWQLSLILLPTYYFILKIEKLQRKKSQGELAHESQMENLGLKENIP
jgi:hypothetical protein